MQIHRARMIGFAAAVLAGSVALGSAAKADWHHGRGHWDHDDWHPHAWYRGWGPPPVYYVPPPPVYYAPPPVVYAPPPVYYPPAVSIGVRIP